MSRPEASIDFEVLPRLLHEMCDGPHGGWSEAVYAFDLPSGGRVWYCQRCYIGMASSVR